MFGRPNISGYFDEYGMRVENYKKPVGAFSYGAESGGWVDGSGGGGHHTVYFSAEDSASVYGGSSSVQPASLRLLPYIKL